MRVLRVGWLAAAVLAGALAGSPANAQPAPPPGAPPSGAAPSPEALALGQQIVEATSGNKDQTLAAMREPMAGMIRQMGVADPAKAQVLVNEAMLPVLSEHLDDYLARQAAIYAQALSVADMRAIMVFYRSPAGRDLVAAQPQLASGRLTSLSQWMQSIQPELVAKLQQVVQAHGWQGTH